MKLLWTLLIALFLAGLFPSLVPAAPPLLLGDAPSYPLAGHLEQLVDPSGKLTLADVLKPTVSSRFKPISGNMNRGYTRDAVWLRFRMERTALFPEQAYLCFGPPFLDTVAVYVQTGADPAAPTSYELAAVGDHVPLSRQGIRTADFELPFSLFNGKIAGKFRSRLQAETNATISYISHECRKERIVTGIEYTNRLRNMLLATQVAELNGTAFLPLKAPLLRTMDGEKVIEPGWLDQVTYWEKQNDGLVNALYRELQIFERKYWVMVENAKDQNFWNPAGSTSK